jgi:hypothetical protein
MKRAERIKIPEQLIGLIRNQSVHKASPGIATLAEAARNRHGESVRAVLFYGSCLRNGNVHEGLADLYLLVDNYHAAFKSHTLAFLNRILPPNVFYLEVPFQGQVLRAKYAVLTLEDFRKGTERWFHSYLWGRFSQQSGIVYVSDELVTTQIHEALACAVMTFIARTLPQMETSFAARDLWSRGLSLSYRAELRPEKPEGSVRLFDADPDYYQALTSAVIMAAPHDVNITEDDIPCRYHVKILEKRRRLNSLGWRIRALQGKVLSSLRLVKALLTFKGGVNYILWKIERHSGVRVEVGPRLKRIPPLAILVIFWRLYRQDAFR